MDSQNRQESNRPLNHEALVNKITSDEKLIDFLAGQGVDLEDESEPATEQLRGLVQSFEALKKYTDKSFLEFLKKTNDKPTVSPENAEALDEHFQRFQKLKTYREQIVRSVSEKYTRIGVPVPPEALTAFKEEIETICAERPGEFNEYVTQHERHKVLSEKIRQVEAEIGQMGSVERVEGELQTSKERIEMLKNAGKVSALDGVVGWAGRFAKGLEGGFEVATYQGVRKFAGAFKEGFKEEDLDAQIREKEEILKAIKDNRYLRVTDYFTNIYFQDHKDAQVVDLQNSWDGERGRLYEAILSLYIWHFAEKQSLADLGLEQTELNALEQKFPGLMDFCKQGIENLPKEIEELKNKKKEKEDVEKAKTEGLSVPSIKRLLFKKEKAKKTVEQALTEEGSRNAKLEELKENYEGVKEAKALLMAEGATLTKLYDVANEAVSKALEAKLKGVKDAPDLAQKATTLRDLGALRKKVSADPEVVPNLFESGGEYHNIEEYEQAVMEAVQKSCEEKVEETFKGNWSAGRIDNLSAQLKAVLNTQIENEAKDQRKEFILEIIRRKIESVRGDPKTIFRLQLLMAQLKKA